ncbi:MAG: hypothetical protein M1508_06475 [Nitrospirae bacterium]|nr:hypothetical protein [Nitrospirota bacterium]MCL5422770.1 hypothetical protein [Nitrospirota bacterium]
MKARKDMVRMGTKVGAVLGAIAFLVFGIIPGFYFGSYGTLVLLNHLFGGPLQATALVRIATAFGILIGIICVGSVTIIVGAIFGTVIGYAMEALTSAVRKEIPSEKAPTETKAK